jgi:cytochrome c biogenesis protein CcdA
MLRLIGVVISIGLADSLNPTTIAPALFLASGEHPRDRVTRFTLGVFLVYFLGGALIAFGPGELLLSLVPKPSATTRHVLELIAGGAMLLAAVLLWRHRERLSERRLPEADPEGKSSAILGATITAVELPTAFPYFAAIAAIVGSGLGPTRQLLLLVIFNVCFVLPLIAVVAILWLAGEGAERVLARAREFLKGNWPALLSGLALLAGLLVIAIGATGLAMHSRSRFGHFSRGVRRILHP